MNIQTQGFDDSGWRIACKSACDRALSGSGCAETVFNKNLHAEIETLMRNMPSAHHDVAREVARNYGYMSHAELESDDQWNSDHGFCSHDLNPYWCPAGCGDIE